MDDELKALRKQLYTYQNRLLEIERIGRLSRTNFQRFEEVFHGRGVSVSVERDLSRVNAFVDTSPVLQNDYILEMIACYLSSADLRSCRQVCISWNKEFTRFYSQRRTIIVTEVDEPEATALASKALKTSIVHVGEICFFDVPNSAPLFKKLLQGFGSTLAGLKLEECKISPQGLATILGHFAPNLESLAYKDRASVESQRESTFSKIKTLNQSVFSLPGLKRLHWDEEFGRVELKEVIAVCPNLIEIVLKNAALPTPESYQELRWDSLKSMKLSPRDELRNEHILTLTALKLKLRRLTLFGVTPFPAKNRMHRLREFLESVSNTLEELEMFLPFTFEDQGVNFASLESPFPVSLPHLMKLNMDFSILTTMKDMTLMPKLKKFECKGKTSKDWETVVQRGYAHKNDNLSHLRLGTITALSLSAFKACFSMCTNLDLEPDFINDEAMRTIIVGFPRLRQLKIAKMTGSNRLPLTDAGLTGVNSLKRSSRNVGSGTNVRSCNDVAIYDLKCLIRLELLSEHSVLTDDAVLLGICKCPKLAILGLPKKCDLTDLSITAIKNCLKLTLLDLPQGTRITQQAIDDLKKSQKNLIVQYGIQSLPLSGSV